MWRTSAREICGWSRPWAKRPKSRSSPTPPQLKATTSCVVGNGLPLLQPQRAEFNAHYHNPSNVETTLYMVKAKFGT